MANCINHPTEQATTIKDGSLYCEICSDYWTAKTDLDIHLTWERPPPGIHWSADAEASFNTQTQILLDKINVCTKLMLYPPNEP